MVTSAKSNLGPFFTNPERHSLDRQSQVTGNAFCRTISNPKINHLRSSTLTDPKPKGQQELIEVEVGESLGRVVAEAEARRGKVVCMIRVHKYGPREPRYQIRVSFFPISKSTEHERFIKLVK
jgi:hypothetical protein